MLSFIQEERSKVDDLRGTPMSVGTLEEIIDDNHAIVSTSVGSEHYVSILSFVDKDLLEPGCSVLLNHKVIISENPYLRSTSFKNMFIWIQISLLQSQIQDNKKQIQFVLFLNDVTASLVTDLLSASITQFTKNVNVQPFLLLIVVKWKSYSLSCFVHHV